MEEMKSWCRVGIDEFTVVLHLPVPIDAKEWPKVADQFLREAVPLSRLQELFGELMPMTSHIPAGYTNAMTIDKIPGYLAIAVHEHYQEMGVCIRFSAEAWAWYQKEYEDKLGEKTNAAHFLQMIQSDLYIVRISRIDLTVDFFNYGEELQPHTIHKALIENKVVVMDHSGRVANRKIAAYEKDGQEETVYIGSKKENSKALCRIYDKRTEQIEKSGFRLDEAMGCENWTRLEVSYRGSYAHQIGEQLIEIRDEIELSQFIAAKISDKYRFYDVEQETYKAFTDDILHIAEACESSFLRSESPKNNSLKKAFSYLIKGSGLFPTLYKVGSIWGEEAETELWNNLYLLYQSDYKPAAHKDRKLLHWIKVNRPTLLKTALHEYFWGSQKDNGDRNENSMFKAEHTSAQQAEGELDV